MDPAKNEYQVGIAARLRVDPRRVECRVRIGSKGGLELDIRVDGRDLNATEQRLVAEYLQEAFHDIKPKIIG